ncbi:protease IV, conjectural [Pyrobaculum aerophilum str. IM2]|uniref:Protease IV, conjectural n=2 Tax=Pyrobaculum aerophilum TaxID=13773 RepID=Q8ZUG6_PYRAE|nr:MULTISPECIES: S49 family peptidase [Pyrobaculum]AAL64441.1 protease IV, conjectural [Pyrobaculum aerophilum str. IM2]HII47297.1 S49 family peptidase [Pyrobaculum aerophilum]
MSDKFVTFGVALALAISVAAIFLVLTTYKPSPPPPQPAKPKIVLVPIDFVLESPAVDKLISALIAVAQRGDVAGIVLLINSPGGTVSATEALYTTVAGINKTKYAVVNGLAASGAYYVAVATERIYATPSSWVGSIGVIAVMWPEEYFYDIPDYIYTTGPLKYYGRELTDYYNDIERVRLNFVQAVLKGRAGRIKASPDVFETASIFTADQAKELGLVDEIGGIFDAVRDMAQRLGLREYEVKNIGQVANATYSPSAEFKVDLNRLLNSTPVPLFYILPTAVQWTISVKTAPNATLQPLPFDKPYVVLDMAHNNMIPRSLIEVLRAELAKRGYVLAAASSEYQLTTLLSNATALVVVNPTAPFSKEAVKAVVNATLRGVRVAYFYDMRASAIVVISGVSYVAPYSLYAVFDPLLMYFNMSGLRAVYNFTAGGANYVQNWQFVEVKPSGEWNLTRGVEKLVLFSPSAVATNAPLRLEARGYVFGYGWGNYTVAAQAGNFVFIGSVRSFTPYYITLGDNWKFFSNLVDWLVEKRPIVRRQGPVSAVIYTN